MLIDIKDHGHSIEDLLMNPEYQQNMAARWYKEHGHAIVDMKVKNGMAEYTTVTDLADIMEYASECRKNNPTGWVYDEKGKKMNRELAALHPIHFQMHPEIKNNKRALIRWLKTEEGKPFCCVEKI